MKDPHKKNPYVSQRCQIILGSRRSALLEATRTHMQKHHIRVIGCNQFYDWKSQIDVHLPTLVVVDLDFESEQLFPYLSRMEQDPILSQVHIAVIVQQPNKALLQQLRGRRVFKLLVRPGLNQLLQSMREWLKEIGDHRPGTVYLEQKLPAQVQLRCVYNHLGPAALHLTTPLTPVGGRSMRVAFKAQQIGSLSRAVVARIQEGTAEVIAPLADATGLERGRVEQCIKDFAGKEEYETWPDKVLVVGECWLSQERVQRWLQSCSIQFDQITSESDLPLAIEEARSESQSMVIYLRADADVGAEALAQLRHNLVEYNRSYAGLYVIVECPQPGVAPEDSLQLYHPPMISEFWSYLVRINTAIQIRKQSLDIALYSQKQSAECALHLNGDVESFHAFGGVMQIKDAHLLGPTMAEVEVKDASGLFGGMKGVLMCPVSRDSSAGRLDWELTDLGSSRIRFAQKIAQLFLPAKS